MRKRALTALVAAALALLLAVPAAVADEPAAAQAPSAPSLPAEALGETQESAPLVQEGAVVEEEALEASLAQIEVDATAAQAYPLSVSKPDQLRARLHTQLSAMATTIDVRDLHIDRTQVDLASLYAEVVNADPDLFFVTSGFRYQYYRNPESPTYNEVAYIMPAAITVDGSITQPFAFPASQVQQMREAYDEALADCLSWVPANATQPQAAKAVHDWLLAHCDYNYDAAATGPQEYGWGPWTSYGALVDGLPVCQGYSLAFMAAMNRLGMEASYVTHRVVDEHGWNRVLVDGNWYNLDITFDDSSSYENDHFFLRSDAWWRDNSDPVGYHSSWTPEGEPGTSTRFDGQQSWTAYTGPGSAPSQASSLAIALDGGQGPASQVYLACDEGLRLSLVQVVPADANTAQAIWSSSDPSVATVDNGGWLSTGSQPGRATVSCTLGSARASIEVLVEAGDLQQSPVDIALSQTQLSYNGKEQHPALGQVLLHAATGEIVLEEGVDFELAWPNDCTFTGDKQLVVRGTGAFTGSVALDFAIRENDKAALARALGSAASLDSAVSSADGTDVAKSRIWVPTQAYEALRSALKAAREVLADPNQTAQQIQDAADALAQASAGFEAAKSKGARPAAWKRLAGGVALDTMQRIAGEAFDSADVAVVATIDGYWDALSASSLAGAHHAPVLLTKGSALSDQTKAELGRLGTKKVYLCGGKGAVSQEAADQIADLGIAVQRVAGANAAGTACAVYDALRASQGETRSETCIVATSATFQDALAASPFAYAAQAPIFLCNGTALDQGTQEAIAQGGFSRIIVMGGTGAVSTGVEQALSAMAPVVRLAGKTAYETSAAMAAFSVDQGGFERSRVALATARGYWDALCGASLCGSTRTPLVLADEGRYGAIEGFVRLQRESIEQGFVLGGTAAVSSATMSAAVSAAQ